MIIRQEKTEDINDIREVNEKAFGKPQEANIINNLRRNCDELLSPKSRYRNHINLSEQYLEAIFSLYGICFC